MPALVCVRVSGTFVNELLPLQMLVYKMLKRHFGREAYYMKLVDLFLEVTLLAEGALRAPALRVLPSQTTFQTEVGQMLDTLCLNRTLEDFTLDRWTLIVKYTNHHRHQSSTTTHVPRRNGQSPLLSKLMQSSFLR